MDNKTIIEILSEYDVETTKNIDEAIYILTDGQLISGMFDYGSRTQDHRCIEALFDDTDRYDKQFWNKVVERTGVVQYVPETQMILLKGSQKPTEHQQELIDEHNLEVDYF